MALVLLGVVASACDGGDAGDPPTSTEAPTPNADAYGAALATVLDDPPPEDDERTVVFVVPLDDGVDIDTQAALIDRFAEAYDVRFVDELAAAVQEGEPNMPPRDDGVVVGMGTITLEPPHRVRLERYRSSGDVQASRVTLEPDDDGWHVAMTEPVPAEVLVDVL